MHVLWYVILSVQFTIFMSWAWIWLAARPSVPLLFNILWISWACSLCRPTFWSQRNGRRGRWTNMRTVKYCQKNSGQQNLSFGMIAARCSTHFKFRSIATSSPLKQNMAKATYKTWIHRDRHCHTFALQSAGCGTFTADAKSKPIMVWMLKFISIIIPELINTHIPKNVWQ